MAQFELLAPAKNLECGMAAITCGADAVYLGAARFGARENAGNSLDDVEALTRFAHRYWAKVYVTVNTLLRDDDLPHALRLTRSLHEIGVDGLIIQDPGLLECDLPPLPLIASTQMHNASPAKVAFLEQVGFRRAILPRELSLEEIKAIRRRTRIELECFIHGALCVSYSGQCYLSYALGGRSGNRGQCAQPCRKAYSLEDAHGRTLARDTHLLSLRDLNLTDHLADLIDVGVTSFKIEGRLKDREYVTNVVSHYRAHLDAILEQRDLLKSSSGRSIIDFTPDPTKTFNRGFTTYFLNGRGAEVASPDTPKVLGEPIGTVATVGERGITLDRPVDLHNGDGICFFNAQGVLCGTTVNAVNGHLIQPYKLEELAPGMEIFRNHDHEFLTRLAKSRSERVIDVSLTLRESPEGVTLILEDEDANSAEVTQACEKTLAEKPTQALETIHKQLSKLGGSGFACEMVAVELSAPYFLPVGLLNALRRAGLEALEAVREENRPVRKGGVKHNSVPYPERVLTYRGNVLNRQAEAFYRRHGVTRIEPAAESGLEMTGRVVMTNKFCLKHQLGYCRKDGGTPVAEPLSLHDEDGNVLALSFDCARCEMQVTLQQRS